MGGTRNLIAAGFVAALLSGCYDEPPGPPFGPPPGADSAGPPGPPPSGPVVARGPVGPGEAVYNQWCLGCHASTSGPNAVPSGRFPPAGTADLERRYKGEIPAGLIDRTDLSPDLVRSVVRQGVGIMPPTRKSEITDEELDLMIAWLIDKK